MTEVSYCDRDQSPDCPKPSLWWIRGRIFKKGAPWICRTCKRVWIAVDEGIMESNWFWREVTHDHADGRPRARKAART